MQYTLKKSLGQHFLHDETMCIKIAETIENAIRSANITCFAEIGPGAGAITKHLLHIKNTNFKAVEIDLEKVTYLLQHYPLLKDKIIHHNFLETTLLFNEPYMVVGNFPYNISTQILFKVLENSAEIPMVIGMFQKEVAQRVVAKHGSKTYGIISVLIQAKYKAEYLFDILPSSFTPPTKVMSGIIKLTLKEIPLQVASEKQFNLLVKTAFNQRRKTLRNACKSLFNAAVLQDEIFNKRAEQLSIEDFAALSFKL
jgi:16S rRNA (adenine1518-N6/adenine1519-N6)-dimethyltransferase